MKKICFLVGDIAFRGGAERITISVANQLAKENDVSILSIANFDVNDVFCEIHNNVKVDSLNRINWGKKGSIRKNYLSIIILLRKYVAINKIDVLVNVQSNNFLWSVPALIGSRTINVCWEHVNYISHKSLIYDFSIFLAKKFAKRIIVLTERDRYLWNSKKVISISNFPEFNIPQVRIEEKQKIIIAVGRFSPQKSFDRLIQIWEIVEKSGKLSDYRLELYGEGDQELYLRNLIFEKGLLQIDIKPFTNRIDLVYSRASLLLMTSIFEGYPMVIIEALQFGVPAIAFDVYTGPAEIIIHNTTGFLIEDGNISEFANVIIKTVTDKKKLLFLQNNNLDYRKQFNSEIIISKWNHLLNSF